MKRTFTFLMMLFCLATMSAVASAQTLVDSFTDGDFVLNPTWTGDVASWEVAANSLAGPGATGSNTLHLNAPGVAGSDYLSTQIATWNGGQEWGFWVGRRAGQTFASTNQMVIWLYANEADLESATVDGYRLLIGDNSGDDEIFLQVVTNGVGTTILTSSGAITNGLSDISFLIRVRRNNIGIFTLFTSTLPTANSTGALATDVPDQTNANVNQGTVTDTTYTPAANGFLGVVAVHPASGNAAVEFDQVYLTTSPTAVRLTGFNATRHKGGVAIRWQSGREVDNLGYNIYREQAGRRVKVNPSLVAGSAFLAGAGTVLTAGHSYSWLDRKGGADSQYWIEDIDLNGTRTLHGPIIPVAAGASDAPSNDRQSALLSQLNSGPATDAATRSVQQGQPASLDNQKSNAGAQASSAGTDTAAQQRLLAAGRAVKLMVKERGWYRVTQGELLAAGLSANANPSRLQLYVDGVEQPMLVHGNDQSQLGTNDWIEFYGTGMSTPWSDTRTYWLVSGSQPGKRIGAPTKSASPSVNSVATGEANHALQGQTDAPAAAVPSFPYTIKRQDRVLYFAALHNGDAENFFGPVVTSDPLEQTLSVRHLNRGSARPAVLEVALQGGTMQSHEVRVSLNGAEVGVMSFADQQQRIMRWSIPQTALVEGDNTLALSSLGGDTDVSAINYARITYEHTYRADDDALIFSTETSAPVRVTGFTNSSIRVFDITNPSAARQLSVTVQRQGAGFMVTIPGNNGRKRILLALTDARTLHPVAINANQPSSWSRSDRRVDFVIITHRDFRQSVTPLAELRRSQGLKVAVIDVEDIYDEFSFGAHSPLAVKDFLAWARSHWQRAPRYVLLVGDASFDPRDYLGFGNLDFVPTKMVDTFYLETASDDALADFDNDAIPEMGVGRLPVRTAAQANTLVSKIKGYVPGQSGDGALLVSDHDEEIDFEAGNEEIRQLLPSTMAVTTVNRGNNPNDQVHSEIVGGINQGPLVVNYMGHGSVEVWTGAGLLSSADAGTLTNGNRLPLFITMTCLNGYFHDVYTESLAEALMKAEDGGAVAVWASSGLTEADAQLPMDKQLVGLLFNDSQSQTLGDAARGAKAATQDKDVRRTWILFGDPTMRIR